MKNLNLIFSASIFSIVFTFVFWALYHVNQPIDQAFLSSHINEFGIQSSKLQLISYVGLIGVLGIVCLFMLLNTKYIYFSKKPEFSSIYIAIALSLFGVPFIFGEFSKWFVAGFFSAGLMILLALKFSNCLFRKRKHLFPLFFVLTLIYVAFYFVAPIFMPLIVMSGAHFAGVESHYAMTVLPGFDFVCCEESGVVERSNYGVSMFMLAALTYKITSLLGALDNPLIASVRGFQIIAAGLLILAVYLLNKRHFLFISMIALAVTASLNTLGAAVYFPNQSGIRYIPFLVGIILMALEIRRENPRILFLSMVVAILLIMSPETGIALFCGYIVSLVLIKYKPASPYKTVFKTCGLFLVLTMFFFVFLFLFLVPMLYRGTKADLFSFLELFSSGYGGLVSRPSVFAIFVVFFAVIAIVRGVLRAREGNITNVDAFQAGIGMMMLVWLSYYFNRMAEWNLWFQAVLVLLLFAPRINFSSLRMLSRKFQFDSVYLWLAVSLMGALVFSSAGRNLYDSLNYYRFVKSSCNDSLHVVKGFCFAGSDGPEISKQVTFLKNLPGRGDYLIISYMPTQVRLMGFNEGFPWYDLFGEIQRDEDLNLVIKWIETKGPRYIATDDPFSAISVQMPNRSQHLQHIVNSLQSYEKINNDSGWIIYERLASS